MARLYGCGREVSSGSLDAALMARRQVECASREQADIRRMRPCVRPAVKEAGMKRVVAVAVIVLAGLAYIGGFWPEHRRAVEAEATLDALRPQLADAQARVRLGEVLGQQLRLSDAIAVRNFGEASTLSSAFFDRVQQEMAQATAPDVRDALAEIQQTRDQVTTAIARTDPTVADVLRQQQIALRRALGYPVPPATPAPSLAAPADVPPVPPAPAG